VSTTARIGGTMLLAYLSTRGRNVVFDLLGRQPRGNPTLDPRHKLIEAAAPVVRVLEATSQKFVHGTPDEHRDALLLVRGKMLQGA